MPILLFTIPAMADLLLQNFQPLDEWGILNFVWQAASFSAFLGSAGFFIGRLARIGYIVAWCSWCLILTIEATTRLGFGMVLDGDWIMILASSSAEEISQFSGLMPWSTFAAALLIGTSTMVGGIWLFRHLPYPVPSKRELIIGSLLLTSALGPMTEFRHPPSIAFFRDFMLLNLPYDSVRHCRQYLDVAKMAVNPDLPDNLHLTAAGSTPLGVVVIGESATRSNWGLYGYERPTTPCLKAIAAELLVFTNATATHPTTGQSLRMTFTDATVEHPDAARCTFAQKCATVGYSCRLLSNQTRWGRWEGVETMLFSGCTEKWYAGEQPRTDGMTRRYDDSLLSPFTESCGHAATNSVPELMFLHLMGSHADPADQYPPSQAVYPRYDGDLPPGLDGKASEWNRRATDVYDNSIVFTDALLGDLIEQLRQTQRPSFLVYFSDHGETPRASYWRSESHPDMFAVPLVIWLSPAYRQTYPQVVDMLSRQLSSPLRLDRLQSILLPLARIEQ